MLVSVYYFYLLKARFQKGVIQNALYRYSIYEEFSEDESPEKYAVRLVYESIFSAESSFQMTRDSSRSINFNPRVRLLHNMY